MALNVRIRDVIIKRKYTNYGEHVNAHKIQFNQESHMIKKDGKYTIDHSNIILLESYPPFEIKFSNLPLLRPESSDTSYIALIEFQNINMDRYYVEQEANLKGINIRNSGRA